MDINLIVLEDELMLEWGTGCYEEWRNTGDYQQLEEPLRYTEYFVHNKLVTEDDIPMPWLLLFSCLLTAQWHQDPTAISSFERAMSINASLVLEHQNDNEAIANSSKITLGEMFASQYSRRPNEEDWLKKALALLQECASLPLSSPTSPGRMALKLLDDLVERWPEKVLDSISSGNLNNSTEFVIAMGFTTRLTRDLGWLEKLSNAFYRGYQNNSHLPSLRKSILRLSQYNAFTELSTADESRLSARLADRHCTLWRLTRHPSDLTAAVAVINQALFLTIKGSEDRFLSTVCFGIVAHQWYLESEHEEERDDIIKRCKSALAETSVEEEVVNVWYTTLLKMLRIKFGRTKNLHALKEAVDYGRKAFHDYAGRLLSSTDPFSIEKNILQPSPVNLLPNSALPDRSGDLSFFLSSLLHDLYKETLNPFLLKESELYSELAINNSPKPDSTELFCQQHFSTLILLYEVTNSRTYLDKAKSLVNSRLTYFETSPGRKKWLQSLGDVFNQGHIHSLRMKSLDESIRLYREALEINPPDGLEGVEMTSALRHALADSLFRRSDLTLDEKNGSLKDVDEALENVNLEMDLLPFTESWAEELKYTIYGLRGQIYLARFQRSGLRDDLDLGIADLNECKMRMDPESVHQSEASYSLGFAFLLSGREYDRCRGKNSLLNAWQANSANPGTRLLAAVRLSRYYAEVEDWQNASMMMDNAMDLFPALQNPLQVLQDIANTARRFSNLVGEAFALTLHAGRGGKRALERLESSRGSILTYLLNQSDDMLDLKSKHEKDATRFFELREILRQRGQRLPLQSMQVETEIDIMRKFDEASIELEELLHKIRKRPGFNRFLLGPDQDQICRVVSTGYIVVVNMTSLRSDALIISSSGLRSIKLQSLIFSEAAEWLRKDLTEYDMPQFGKKNALFRDFLAWLWRVCVRDILSTILGYNNNSGGIPRVWWMGIGTCAYFPFHAAGIHDGVSQEYTLASVVSSYIPTLRSFINAKRQTVYHGMPDNHPSLLMVKMQSTPGKNNLPGVADEQSVIEKYNGSELRFESISQCTSDKVLQSIEDYDIVHFACHGVSNDNESGLDSSLVFEKEDSETGEIVQDKLYVQQIYNKRLKRARLAYLSACSTAHLADVRLIDEGVHLVSSFMIAGFTHVVGTLWTALDDTCVDMSECFYKQYLNEAGGGSDDVAFALHRATIEIRSKHPKQPLRWAPYVHYGT